MADTTCTCGECTYANGQWYYRGFDPDLLEAMNGESPITACPDCRDWLNADGTITTAAALKADHEAMEFLRTYRPELVPLAGVLWRVSGDEITRNSAAQEYAATDKDPAKAVLNAKGKTDNGRS